MRVALALALALAASHVAAADPRGYLQVDNDSLFGTDRWYTSGVRIARVSEHGVHEAEFALVQDIWTPEAKRFVRGTIDRAPTARLVLAAARHDRSEALAQTVEAQLGVRGRGAAGERSTDVIHSFIAAPEVDWSREVSTRLEARLAATRSHRFDAMSLHYGATVGTLHTFAHVGAQYDFGPVRFDSPMLRHAATPPFDRFGGRGWSAFVGASALAFATDRTLDRAYDPFTVAPKLERLRGRLAAGVAWHAGWGTVALSAAADTREFESQRQGQRYGSLAVSIPF